MDDKHLLDRDTYHVFTNGWDDYFYNYKEANKAFKVMAKEYGCARMYLKRKGTDEDCDGDCIRSEGAFPS